MVCRCEPSYDERLRTRRSGDDAGSPGELAVERLDGVRKIHAALLIGEASKLVRLLRAETVITTAVACCPKCRYDVHGGGVRTFGDGPLPASEARRFMSRAR